MAALHFSLWCSKFHCCNLDAKSSTLFFGSSRSLLRSLSPPSVILWFSLCSASSLHLLKLMAAVLRCLKKHCLRRQSTQQNCPEVQGQEVHRHEAQVELLMVYSDKVLIFSSWTYILNREHRTDITVNTVIARHPPNRGHSKRRTTSFSIHLRIKFG